MADALRARESLAAFASMAGRPMTAWQAEALRLDVRTSVVVAPRQSGKSRSLAVLALWWAYRRRGQRVLIVSAGKEASRRLLAEVRAIATGSPFLRGSVVDETAGLLTLTNGSEVRSVPASERQVRGWSVDLLLVDEAALVPEDLLLGAALPTTAARPDARVVLASSPATAAGAFYDAAMRGRGGSEHTRTWTWALTDCEWISPSQIEAARESMTETRFRCEYEGEFASGADSLFSKWTLDRATVDVVVPGFQGLTGPARVLGGVDWGQTTDRSTLVTIARIAANGAEPVFVVAAAHAWRAGEPLVAPGGVTGQVAGSAALFDTLTAESNGLGGPCAEHLFRLMRDRARVAGGGPPGQPDLLPDPWDGDWWAWRRERANRARRGEFATQLTALHTTSESKAATYSTLRLLMDRGCLVLPASLEALRRELLLLRVDLSPTGSERIEASSGHDDLADGLYLAAGPYRDRDGAWRSRLGDLCDPGNPLPDPWDRVDPPTAGAAVRTADGRLLPFTRTPALQSVEGPEVTHQTKPAAIAA